MFKWWNHRRAPATPAAPTPETPYALPEAPPAMPAPPSAAPEARHALPELPPLDAAEASWAAKVDEAMALVAQDLNNGKGGHSGIGLRYPWQYATVHRRSPDTWIVETKGRFSGSYEICRLPDAVFVSHDNSDAGPAFPNMYLRTGTSIPRRHRYDGSLSTAQLHGAIMVVLSRFDPDLQGLT